MERLLARPSKRPVTPQRRKSDMVSERSIAIFAPGLLGGSLALAIREKSPQSAIRIWARRDEALHLALHLVPGATGSTDAAAVIENASLALLCMPVQHMEGLAKQIATSPVSPDLIVTDVGSVKGAVVAGLTPILSAAGISFIGSHPMAGSHATGMEHASARLFENAACLLTPVDSTPPAHLERLRGFWAALGCRVMEMTPAAHDHCVARVSHLPHAMAVLTTLAALQADPAVLACSAGGFRDTTRVAAGDPAMWAGILTGNRAEVRAALQDAAASLHHLLEILDSTDEEALRRFLAQAKTLRDLLPPGRPGP
jgi:prephenate dehydrogenase